MDPVIQLENIFSDIQADEGTKYIIRGFVCYRSRHYVSVFHNIKTNSWVMANDAKVLKMGTWDKVEKKMRSMNLYPVMVFYENLSRFEMYRDENEEFLEELYASEYELDIAGFKYNIDP